MYLLSFNPARSASQVARQGLLQGKCERIIALYEKHTLARVRDIMIKETRAYRGQLTKWGVRKYNCRGRNGRGSVSSGDQDGSLSGSDSGSSPPSQLTINTSHELIHYPTGGNARDNEPRMANLLGRYDQGGVNAFQDYPENYGKTEAAMPHEWGLPSPQSATVQTHLGQGNVIGDQGSYYTHPLISPNSSTFSPATSFDSGDAGYGRQHGAQPIQYGTSYHESTGYSTNRGYRHERSTVEHSLHRN
ncbi:hypothetical protein F4777DRAFT_388158 [Nemania sp. FL0916]|nr:hypothetical protein F4777DRAFT_388158 [Nemania sp. FL0916]